MALQSLQRGIGDWTGHYRVYRGELAGDWTWHHRVYKRRLVIGPSTTVYRGRLVTGRVTIESTEGVGW